MQIPVASFEERPRSHNGHLVVVGKATKVVRDRETPGPSIKKGSEKGKLVKASIERSQACLRSMRPPIHSQKKSRHQHLCPVYFPTFLSIPRQISKNTSVVCAVEDWRARAGSRKRGTGCAFPVFVLGQSPVFPLRLPPGWRLRLEGIGNLGEAED